MPNSNSTKQCCKCKNIKSRAEFYKNSSKADGLQTACKICNKKGCAEYSKTDKSKRYHYQYRKTDRGKLLNAKWCARYAKTDAAKIAKAKYRSKNKIKINAKDTINRALRRNHLIKPSNCEECDSTQNKLDGHHDDYSFPMVVRWLCRGCHLSWHRANGAGING